MITLREQLASNLRGDHDVLRHAWRRFGAFDAVAVDSQRRFLQLRRMIPMVGVLAVAAGLISMAAGDAASQDPDTVLGLIHPSIRWLTLWPRSRSRGCLHSARALIAAVPG